MDLHNPLLQKQTFCSYNNGKVAWEEILVLNGEK